jgi:integrase/recombinase XerD
MPRKGEITPQRAIGDLRDPDSLINHLRRFQQWRQEKQYSASTIKTGEEHIRSFIVWCDQRSLTRPHDITRPILERYQRHLFLYRKQDGQPLTPRTQRARIAPLCSFFTWLAKQNHILYNPASDLDMPRLDRRLPKHILSVADVETILALPELDTLTGLRDRAILETFYSTGIRRMEMVNLGIHDVNHARGTLMVRQGKGRKDRMVPIGDRALAWIAKYSDDVRPQWMTPADDGKLFLTQQGEPFTPGRMSQLVRDYVRAAKLGKSGSCHLLRHTMATLMLDNGADLRFVQEMLGHANIETTQVYTHVSIQKLKDIHTATHPGRMIVGRKHANDMGNDAFLAALGQEAAEEDIGP